MTSALQPSLLQGETIYHQTQFTPSAVTPHLKTTVTVTDRRVIVHRPQTIFGFIERGYLLEETPLRHVTEVTSGNTTSTRHITYGSAAVFVGFMALMMSMGSPIGGASVLFTLICLGVGAVFFLTAHRNALVIRNTGSGTLSAYGSKTETPAIADTAVKLGELIFS